MDLDLKDNVVVVVGAASGIGRAAACEFGRQGALVVALDKSPDVASLGAFAGAETNPPPAGWQVDATDFMRVKQAAQAVLEQHGRCDHVVVSIGLGSGKYGFPFWNLDPDDWAPVLQVNLLGAVNVAHAFAPLMLAARRGTLCFVASVAGQIGSQTDPPYSAAKAALINFAQCAAKDLAPYNIRVNVVSPGMVKTPLNQRVWQAWREVSPENTLSYEQWADAKIKQVAPLGRWQQAADVADMIVFLASKRAANVTGQTLNVDGGQVMHS